MSRPPDGSGKKRPGGMPSFGIGIPLAGCGFALTFGWLWFPALRDVFLFGLFTGPSSFAPFVFGFALAVGCFLYSQLCGHMENGAIRQRFLNAVLAHGVPPLLLCSLLLLRGNGISFAVLDETLVGLAGALPGVWWTSRLLASGPRNAVASLAWAAFVAMLLALPLSRQRPGSAVTVCILIAGFVLACLVALMLVRGERERSGKEDSLPDTAAPLKTPYLFGPFRGAYALFLCGVAPIFFGLGSLNVLAQGMEGAVPVPTVARICALTAAVFLLDGSPVRMLAIAACVQTVLVICLPLAPELAPMLFPVGAAMLQAAGVALCAAALRRETFGQGGRAAAASLAGLFLPVTLAAVNGGYLAGRELASFAGETWPVLPGLATALLLAAVADQGRRRMAGVVPARGGTELQQPLSYSASGEDRPATAAGRPITGQLTKREQALASLLVKGHTNKEAAKNMGVKENTLRWHIKKLNKKLGTDDREELIMALKGNNE